MFVRRPIIEQNPFAFPVEHDFGYDNLVVGGCSFTYNNSDEHACSWPYYLKDLGNFKSVYDCSMPGAGNYHIFHSLQWALTLADLDPLNTLVIVMWSGNERDDQICSPDALNSYPARHFYDSDTATAITGGNHPNARGNILNESMKLIDKIKTQHSRAVENFLYIDGLRSWLDHHQYKSIFLDYLDRTLPCRANDFDLREHLPNRCQKKLDDIFDECKNIYAYCLKNGLLGEDDFHPSVEGHLVWTRECLVPYLKSLNI